MQLKLLAFGSKMPSWVTTAFTEFQKRLQPYANISLIELAIPKRGKNYNADQLKKREADIIEQHINKGEIVIALDEHGQQWDSPEFAGKIQVWHDENATVCFVIGGPDGLDKKWLQSAQQRWSLGALVYPHALVRIILIEQLYRGFSILNNHPYHRS